MCKAFINRISSTLYRNDGKDRIKTYFDIDGRELYAVRLEDVNDL